MSFSRTIAEVVIGFLLLVAVFFGLSILFTPRAEALSDPLGSVRVYSFDCGTTALNIKAPTFPKSSKSMRIVNMSATPVFVGGPDVNLTTQGYGICSDAAVCESKSLAIDSNPVIWCAVTTGTVTVKVVAGL